MYQLTNCSHRSISLGDGSELEGRKSTLRENIEINSRVSQLIKTGVLIINEVIVEGVKHDAQEAIRLHKQQEAEIQAEIEKRKQEEFEEEKATGIVKISKQSESSEGRQQKAQQPSETNTSKGK